MGEELRFVYETATAALGYLKKLANVYLKQRKYDKSYDELVKELQWRDLNIAPKPIIPRSVNDQTLRDLYIFYFNMQLSNQLVNFVSRYTREHQDEIEHSEEIEIKDILSIFKQLKEQIGKVLGEAKLVLRKNKIALPRPRVEFDTTVDRKVRDFLIVKFLIEELKSICQTFEKLKLNLKTEL